MISPLHHLPTCTSHLQVILNTEVFLVVLQYILSCGFYYPSLHAVHVCFSVAFLVFTFLVFAMMSYLLDYYTYIVV